MSTSTPQFKMGFQFQMSLNSGRGGHLAGKTEWDSFRSFVLLWWFSVGYLLNICTLSCISICQTVLYHYSLAFKILSAELFLPSDCAPAAKLHVWIWF